MVAHGDEHRESLGRCPAFEAHHQIVCITN
jgi:hypothetical protein